MMNFRRCMLGVMIALLPLAMTGCLPKTEITTKDSQISMADDTYSDVSMKKVKFNGLKKYIDINMECGNVTIKKSSDKDIHVEYVDGVGIRVEEMGSMISVRYQGSSINSDEPVIIHMPDVYKGEVNAKIDNGGIQIGDMKDLEKLELELTNGNINCENVVAKEVELASKNGKVMFANLDADKSIDIKIENGNIEGSFAKDINKYKVTTDIKGNRNIPENIDGEGAEVHIECANGSVNI